MGNRTSEKKMFEREESRDEIWGWREETEEKAESEDEEGGTDEDLMENGLELEDVD